MSDIVGIIDYEHVFTLHMKHPLKDEELLGITVEVRSAASEAAKSLYRQQASKTLERRSKNKLPAPEVMEREEYERIAACIKSWNWGDKTFENGETPGSTIKEFVRVMAKLPWFYGQVKEACENPENFSETSQTN